MADAAKTKVEEFFASYTSHTYKKGQVIILNDMMPRNIFYIVSGRIKQYDITPRGEEVILNVFRPSAFFPMSIAINNTPSPFIFEAETDVVLKQAPIEDVLALIKKDTEVLFDLLARVYRGVDGLLLRMSQLMSGSARSRLLQELIIETRRNNVKTQDDICTLQLRERDLAARVGLTRETISRELAKLKRDGVAEISSTGLTIYQVSKLDDLLAAAQKNSSA